MCPKARFFWGPQFIRTSEETLFKSEEEDIDYYLTIFACTMLRKESYCSAVYFRKLISQAEGKLKY